MVTVRVPATTANLGPGFDALGLALALYNEIRVTRASHTSIALHGEGEKTLPRDEHNLVYQAMQRLAQEARTSLPPVHLHMRNRIPLQSGLGSSSAAIVGGLVAARTLLNVPLSEKDLLRLAVALEGHPDNVAPALLGGLVIVAAYEEGPLVARVPTPPDLRVVVVLPEVHVSTEEARRLLPAQVSLTDAVFNLSRTALVVHALRQGDYDLLARAMVDRLHQPYRKALIPGYDGVITAAREAGASAVIISGSGPAVAAFAPEGHERIAGAMVDAFARAGVTARAWVLPVGQGADVSVE